jgi:hypothetical protein
MGQTRDALQQGSGPSDTRPEGCRASKATMNPRREMPSEYFPVSIIARLRKHRLNDVPTEVKELSSVV